MLCRRSSVVEQLFCKQQVVSSNLTVGSTPMLSKVRIKAMPKKEKQLPSQSTDAFEFIGSMAKKRKVKSEEKEKETLEEKDENCRYKNQRISPQQ